MKNRLNKLLTMAVVLAMCFGALAACNSAAPAATATPAPQQTTAAAETATPAPATGTAESTGTPAQWEYQKDTSAFEFTVWWPSVWSWAKPAVEAGWDDSPIYQQITAKTGGKMKIDMPAGTDDELIGPMLASGDLPDVMVFSAYNTPYIPQMKDAGQIYCFGDLIDQYAPTMWNLVSPSELQYHADSDGKLWKYVGFEYDEKCFEAFDLEGIPRTHGTNIMFARKDILAAYGKQDITDLDDFTSYLNFCKQNYPDADALRLPAQDPRGDLFIHFKSTFGCNLSDTYPQADGSLKYYWYDPHYVDYLKWLNGLFKSGVVSANMLTETAQQKDDKMYSAKYGAFLSAMYNAYNTVNETIKKNQGNDTQTYVDIGPIQKQGVKWEAMALRSKGGPATVITKNAKLPDRIIQFYEYLLTDEGQMLTNAGVEGVNYDMVDGKWTPKKEAADMAVKDLQGYVTKYKVNGPWAPWVKTYYWEYYLGTQLTPTGFVKDETLKRLPPSNVRDIWQEGFADIAGSIDPGSDLDVLRTQIDGLCKEAGMKMIAAADDAAFQKLYSDCTAQIEQLGVSKIEKAYTDEHQAQLKALGK